MDLLPFSTVPVVPNSLQLAIAGAGAPATTAPIGTAPAAGINIGVTSVDYVFTANVGMFVRIGATCLADGTDRYIPPNFPIVSGIPLGATVSANGAAAGILFLTPGA